MRFVLGQAWSHIRWVVLLFFCLYNFSNTIQWIAFSTIVDETRELFDCSAWQVNALSVAYPIVFVIIGIPCSALYDHLGLRNGMLIGNALNAVGALIKVLTVYIAGAAGSSPSWYSLMVAQLFCAASSCFVFGLPPMVASAWFGTKERSLATSIASVSNILGIAVGFPLPPMLVYAMSDLKSQFANLFNLELGLCVLALLGSLVFVCDGPKNAPAVTARRRADPVPVLPSLKALFTNWTFVILMVVIGATSGTFGALTTLMAQINKPFGITNNETGWIGSLGCFLSIFGSVVVGYAIDRLRRYKLPLLLLCLGITISMSAIIVSFATHSSVLANAYVWYSLMQILNSCVYPVVFEFSVELTYPIPEALSGTVMMVLPCAMGAVIVLCSSYVLGEDPSEEEALVAVAICLWVTAASGIVAILIREDLRRVGIEGGAVEGLRRLPTSLREVEQESEEESNAALTPNNDGDGTTTSCVDVEGGGCGSLQRA